MTRNKKLVKMMALAVAASTVATSVPAYAAFDANYYAQQNPDVVAAIGTKPADLEMHYNVFGKKEGRAGSADEIGGSALRQLFDAEYYAKMNPDVAAVYGNDANALFSHFLQFGIKEGRKINPYFDVNAYKKAYPDLVAAFGDDIAAYYNHFATNGIKEHRTLGGFPAEKIVPGGVAVAYSGDSGSSSGGGGGSSSSSKPSTKPSETTPTPTPAPQPEPEPEPAPEPAPKPENSQDYIDVAIGIANANTELDTELTAAGTTVTKAQKASFVARALNNLNDAEALKTLTAENLEVAEDELEVAQKALIAANNNLANAASSNTALGNFTTSKRVVANVRTKLNDYYDAIDAVEAAQNTVDAKALLLDDAKAANDVAQAAYDKAFDNVKSTILAVDDTKKASDFDKKEDSDVVDMLIANAGNTLTYTAGTGGAADTWAESTAVSLGDATAALVELKRKYANYKVNEELITDTGRVSEVVHDRLVRNTTATTNAAILVKMQVLYLNSLLSDESNYDITAATTGALNDDAVDKLKSIGFTTAEITAINDATVFASSHLSTVGIDFAVGTDNKLEGTVAGAGTGTEYSNVAKKLTADSSEISSTRYTITGGTTVSDQIDNIDIATSGSVSGKTYSDISDALVKQAVKDNIDTYVDQYKATSAALEYSKANDVLNGTAITDGTKKGLEDAENDKKLADETLADAKEDLKEAEIAVDEAEKERDEAYAAAGVDGNAELLARDAAIEDEVREQHEYANAVAADTAAKNAYNDAIDNYADASKLNVAP